MTCYRLSYANICHLKHVCMEVFIWSNCKPYPTKISFGLLGSKEQFFYANSPQKHFELVHKTQDYCQSTNYLTPSDKDSSNIIMKMLLAHRRLGALWMVYWHWDGRPKSQARILYSLSTSTAKHFFSLLRSPECTIVNITYNKQALIVLNVKLLSFMHSKWVSRLQNRGLEDQRLLKTLHWF